jgi:hypothetical protein
MKVMKNVMSFTTHISKKTPSTSEQKNSNVNTVSYKDQNTDTFSGILEFPKIVLIQSHTRVQTQVPTYNHFVDTI